MRKVCLFISMTTEKKSIMRLLIIHSGFYALLRVNDEYFTWVCYAQSGNGGGGGGMGVIIEMLVEQNTKPQFTGDKSTKHNKMCYLGEWFSSMISKQVLYYWPCVRGILCWPWKSPHKGPIIWSLMGVVMSAWTNRWKIIGVSDDFRRHYACVTSLWWSSLIIHFDTTKSSSLFMWAISSYIGPC